MPRGRQPDVLRHSVIDRLAGSGHGRDGRVELRIGVDELRLAVRRDLEWLLNTRRLLEYGLETLPEARASILAYGLPDLASFSASSTKDRGEMCSLITDAIRKFEPRLEPSTLAVEAVPSADDLDSRLHFRIHGVIRVEPVREAVQFDTTVDPNTGALSVEDSDA